MKCSAPARAPGGPRPERGRRLAARCAAPKASEVTHRPRGPAGGLPHRVSVCCTTPPRAGGGRARRQRSSAPAPHLGPALPALTPRFGGQQIALPAGKQAPRIRGRGGRGSGTLVAGPNGLERGIQALLAGNVERRLALGFVLRSTRSLHDCEKPARGGREACSKEESRDEEKGQAASERGRGQAWDLRKDRTLGAHTSHTLLPPPPLCVRRPLWIMALTVTRSKARRRSNGHRASEHEE